MVLPPTQTERLEPAHAVRRNREHKAALLQRGERDAAGLRQAAVLEETLAGRRQHRLLPARLRTLAAADPPGAHTGNGQVADASGCVYRWATVLQTL